MLHIFYLCCTCCEGLAQGVGDLKADLLACIAVRYIWKAFFFHCSVILMRDICTSTQSKYNHLEIFLAFEKIMFLTHLLLLHSSNTKVERNKNVAIKICTAYSV